MIRLANQCSVGELRTERITYTDGSFATSAQTLYFHGENNADKQNLTIGQDDLSLSHNIKNSHAGLFDGNEVTIPETGVYVIHFQITVSHTESKIRNVRLELSRNTGSGYGTDIIARSSFNAGEEAGIALITVNGTFMGELQDGDKLKVQYTIATQDDEGAIDIPAGMQQAYISGRLL